MTWWACLGDLACTAARRKSLPPRWPHYCSRRLCRFHTLHFITASIINKADPEKNNSHWEQIICNQVQMMGILTESALKRWAKQKYRHEPERGMSVLKTDYLLRRFVQDRTCSQNPGKLFTSGHEGKIPGVQVRARCLDLQKTYQNTRGTF